LFSPVHSLSLIKGKLLSFIFLTYTILGESMFNFDYCSMLNLGEIKDIARQLNDTVREDNPIKLSGKGRTLSVISSEVSKALQDLDKQILQLLEKDYTLLSQFNVLVNKYKLQQCTKFIEAKHSKPTSRVYDLKPTKKIVVSPYSPGLKASFARIGFTDQNGSSYTGAVAVAVLTELWHLDDSLLAPPEELKIKGIYLYPATVQIKTAKKRVEISRNGILTEIERTIHIPRVPTLFENGNKNCKVISPGWNGDKTRVEDTLPLFVNLDIDPTNPLKTVGGQLCIDNLIRVDWHQGERFKGPTVKKIQGTSDKVNIKSHTKEKINWGTRYLPVEYNPSSALGHNISLPDNDKADSPTTRYRLVLESTGRINLYLLHDNSFYCSLGKFSPQYDTKALGYTVQIGFYTSVLQNRPYWAHPLDAQIGNMLASRSKASDDRVHKSITAYNQSRYSYTLGKNLSRKQRQNLKSSAKKAIFKLYDDHSLKSDLPIDILKACDDLRFHKIYNNPNDRDVTDYLAEDERIRVTNLSHKKFGYYNHLLVGYYLKEINPNYFQHRNEKVNRKQKVLFV
jgi:hypothetical protein